MKKSAVIFRQNADFFIENKQTGQLIFLFLVTLTKKRKTGMKSTVVYDLICCCFLQEELEQTLVVKLPDTLAMCHEPPVEKSLEEMEKLLLLILGAAVQCSHKEDLIGSIKNLPIETQHAFVDKIKEVFDCDLFFIALCIIFNLMFLLICL